MAAPRSEISELGTWPLEASDGRGIDGEEVRLIEVAYPPNAISPAHRHPGWQLIYVLEGPVLSQMEGEDAPREYRTGEYWFEPREHLHVMAGNPRSEGTGRILVFYVTEPGQPVLIPEPDAS